MLEQWLKTLEQEKQRALGRIRQATNNPKTLDLANKEIEINEATVVNFLNEMARKGFKLKEGLCRVPEDYDTDLDYRRAINHVEQHLAEITDAIPSAVEKGDFEPTFARHY